VGAEFDDGRLRITRVAVPPGLRVEGEVDAATRAAFSQVLQTAVGRARQDLHVDLSRLRHIDLGGLRVLAAAANALEGELTLVLAPLPARMRRLIELAGWDDGGKLRLDRGPCPGTAPSEAAVSEAGLPETGASQGCPSDGGRPDGGHPGGARIDGGAR
jgi:anti-anti-sigma factor